MTNSFRARFFRKFDDGRIDSEVEESVFSFDVLKEQGKLKPPNTFNFKKVSYIFDRKAIVSTDKSGNPILEYYVGNANPIMKDMRKIPAVKDEDGKFVVVDGELFNRTFDRGEMKAVIASSQKEPQKFDWMSLVIGIAMGAMIGAFVMIFVYPSLFPTPHVVTNVTSTGASILAKLGFR